MAVHVSVAKSRWRMPQNCRAGRSVPWASGQTRSFTFIFCNRFDELDEPAADLGTGDAHEGTHQLHAFRSRQEFNLLAIARDDSPSRVGQPLKEELDGHSERRGDLLQAARADAVGASLVLVYLLKSDLERLAELFLAHANNQAPHADAAADVKINPIGFRHLRFSLVICSVADLLFDNRHVNPPTISLS